MSEPTPQPGAPTPSDPAPTRPATPEKDPLRGSRTSGAWAAVILASALLVLLVVFIIQNTESTNIEFLAFDGSVPLAAALLIAAVAGMAVVGAIGSLRILQLRRRVKRGRR